MSGLALFPFQREIVEWAVEAERCAIFADTGLGKAAMQLSWAREVGGRVLVLAPLAVARQTEREAAKFGIEGVKAVRHPDETDAPIVVTNYERLHLFQDREWDAIVLDESSILKSYRLCCTATPAPNDHTELGNHAEFLGVLTRAQMLGTYFVHDDAATPQEDTMTPEPDPVLDATVGDPADYVETTPTTAGLVDELRFKLAAANVELRRAHTRRDFVEAGAATATHARLRHDLRRAELTLEDELHVELGELDHRIEELRADEGLRTGEAIDTYRLQRKPAWTVEWNAAWDRRRAIGRELAVLPSYRRRDHHATTELIRAAMTAAASFRSLADAHHGGGAYGAQYHARAEAIERLLPRLGATLVYTDETTPRELLGEYVRTDEDAVAYLKPSGDLGYQPADVVTIVKPGSGA